MTRKQLTVLVVLVAVVGIAGFLFYQRGKTSWQVSTQRQGAKLLAELPINDVAQITIASGTNALTLAKKEGTWCVRQRADYPANYSEISSLLLKLLDLKAVQTDEVTPAHLARYNLLPPGPDTNTATLLELADQNGKPLKTLLLGKHLMRKAQRPSPMDDLGDSGWPAGRYLMIGTNAKTVALVSETFTQIEPKPEQWITKDFFKPGKIKTASVQFQAAANSWKLTRESEGANWQLLGAQPDEKLDATKVSGLNYALSSPYFNDVLPADTAPESIGLDKPTVITLETFDDFTYVLRVGSKTNDAYPIHINVSANLRKERNPGPDENPQDKERLDREFNEHLKKLEEKLAQERTFADWVYLVPSWSLDVFMKERAKLLQTEQAQDMTAEDATAGETSSAADATEGEVEPLEMPVPLDY